MFLEHFFGENVLFYQFDPRNTPKCYTWLESCRSSLRDGKNKKIFFPPCEASDFRGRSQTDFLHDLRARHKCISLRIDISLNHGYFESGNFLGIEGWHSWLSQVETWLHKSKTLISASYARLRALSLTLAFSSSTLASSSSISWLFSRITSSSGRGTAMSSAFA